MPTASAVVADLIDVYRNITENSPKRIPMHFYRSDNAMSVTPISSITPRYYLRFSVVDKPKVMAAISSVLGEHNISIASVIQKEGTSRDFVSVIMLTSEAIEKNLQNAVSEIETLDIVKQKTQIIRIED
jgi:homoserine dehydrogenase